MSSLPAPVLDGVQSALATLGLPGRVLAADPVGGGCINHGARLTLEGGRTFFLKWNASAPPRFFEAEADGLRALAAPGVVRVPQAVALGGGSASPHWLLLEYLVPEPPGEDYEERLGRGLARLHASAPAGAPFGWARSNWIGSLPQANRPATSWAEFWRERRLAPQLQRARDRQGMGSGSVAAVERAMALTAEGLADVDQGPVHLIHGDLWGGNTFCGPDGAPVLIDPAVYLGHGEVDLAMTELFGGFGGEFYRAYAEEGTVTPAYQAYRRDLYQLYYLLVHVNLFGSQYEARTRAAAERAAAALGG